MSLLYNSIVQRLKERARYWKFERLDTSEMTTEEELIILRFIEGMHDLAFKHKLLETLQSVNLIVETCTEFFQQLELIKCITNYQTKEKCTAEINTKFYANTEANSMSRKKNIVQPSVRYAPFA